MTRLTYHIVHPTEQPWAIRPFTLHSRIMLSLMPRPILPTAEPALSTLRTTLLSTKQRLCMALVMLAQVAASRERRSRGTTDVGALPTAVRPSYAPSAHLCRAG